MTFRFQGAGITNAGPFDGHEQMVDDGAIRHFQ